jgi:hypothetical protein
MSTVPGGAIAFGGCSARNYKAQNGMQKKYSVLHVFLQVLGANLGSVDGAAAICSHAFGAAGHLVIRIYLGIWNEGSDRAGCGAPDSDTSPPARVICAPRFRIGYIDDVVLIDEDSAWPPELRPLRDEGPILVENLNAVVSAIANENPAF